MTGCALFLSLNYIVTSGHDAKIQVWSTLHKNTLVHSFNQHARAVTGLARHSVPGLLVSASLDGTVRVWDVESLKELCVYNFPHFVYSSHVDSHSATVFDSNRQAERPTPDSRNQRAHGNTPPHRWQHGPSVELASYFDSLCNLPLSGELNNTFRVAFQEGQAKAFSSLGALHVREAYRPRYRPSVCGNLGE